MEEPPAARLVLLQPSDLPMTKISIPNSLAYFAISANITVKPAGTPLAQFHIKFILINMSTVIPALIIFTTNASLHPFSAKELLTAN